MAQRLVESVTNSTGSIAEIRRTVSSVARLIYAMITPPFNKYKKGVIKKRPLAAIPTKQFG